MYLSGQGHVLGCAVWETKAEGGGTGSTDVGPVDAIAVGVGRGGVGVWLEGSSPTQVEEPPSCPACLVPQMSERVPRVHDTAHPLPAPSSSAGAPEMILVTLTIPRPTAPFSFPGAPGFPWVHYPPPSRGPHGPPATSPWARQPLQGCRASGHVQLDAVKDAFRLSFPIPPPQAPRVHAPSPRAGSGCP